MQERFGKVALLAATLLALTACGGQQTTADQQEASPVNAPVQEMQTQSSGVTLYVRQAGGPEPDEVLIAINGGPGQSSEYMTGLERLASPDLAIVTYDQRGTGRSDSPTRSNENYELADYAADLEAIRQLTGVERVHLFGHSWGALIAMGYVTTYPEHTESLTVMGGAAPDWDGIQAGMNNFGQRLVELQQAGVISTTLPSGGAQQFEAILPAYLSDPAGDLEAWQVPAYDQQTNQLTWSNLAGYDLTRALSGLEMPVLILWGEDDPFGQGMAEATRDALTKAEVQYVLLDACGHYWHECPEQFYAAVEEFLAR